MSYFFSEVILSKIFPDMIRYVLLFRAHVLNRRLMMNFDLCFEDCPPHVAMPLVLQSLLTFSIASNSGAGRIGLGIALSILRHF
jgi:hypothetical protein